MLDFERQSPTLVDRLCQAQLDAFYPRSASQDVHYALHELAGLEDFDQLPGELGEPEEGDGLLKVINAAELALALWTTNELGIGRFTPPTILDKVDHERQHADAAVALGLRAVHALRFKLLGSGNLGVKTTTIPVSGPVTKLGFAAMLAHPHRLSNSDIRQIRFLGYNDAHDIATRIESSGQAIPLPLSVQ